MTTSDIEQRAAFDLVRYAQCWEDADVLLEALEVKEGETCLSIAPIPALFAEIVCQSTVPTPTQRASQSGATRREKVLLKSSILNHQ